MPPATDTLHDDQPPLPLTQSSRKARDHRFRVRAGEPLLFGHRRPLAQAWQRRCPQEPPFVSESGSTSPIGQCPFEPTAFAMSSSEPTTLAFFSQVFSTARSPCPSIVCASAGGTCSKRDSR